MRVLTVAADVPSPPVGGARTRNYHLLRALAAEHGAVVCAFDWGGRRSQPPFGVDLRTVPWTLPPLHEAVQAGDAGAWKDATAPGAEPLAIGWYASAEMEAAVAAACDEGIDAVVMTETAMARFAGAISAGVPRVLDLHDVQARKLARAGRDDQARRMLDFERRAVQACDLVTCVSALEAAAARDLLGAARVEVVPNGVDTTAFVPGGGGGDDVVVFTGSLHTAENAEAAAWLAQEVVPPLRRLRPGCVTHLVGAAPGADVLALEGDGVRVVGPVDEVVTHLHAAAIAVVPVRSGGGTRLKLLEAAAAGCAIVTTTVGMEGLELVPGRDLVVADEPGDFAAAIAALCADPTRRRDLGANARAASLPYDWAAIGARYRDLVEAAASLVPGAP